MDHNFNICINGRSLREQAPLSTDAHVIAEFENIDYQPISTEVAKKGQAPRPVRVYMDGVFDLFHFGHMNAMKQAKNAFPNVYLIAGVCTDHDTHRVKGRPVCNQQQRIDSIVHCRYVDEVCADVLYTPTVEWARKMKIDFVAHDDSPSTDAEKAIYAELKANDMYVETQRTEGVSTTDLVARILANVEAFTKRNEGKACPVVTENGTSVNGCDNMMNNN